MSNCLERDNHNVTRGALSLRCRLDALVVAKRDMHDAALIRSHGAKLHAAMLLGSLCGSITSDGLKLLSLTVLVALNIDDDRVAEAHSTNSDGRDQELQGIEGLTMATDENCQVVTGDVEDKLAFIAFVLVDGDLTDVEVLQNVLDSCDGGIRDTIEILVADAVLFDLGVVSLFCGHFHVLFFCHLQLLRTKNHSARCFT